MPVAEDAIPRSAGIAWIAGGALLIASAVLPSALQAAAPRLATIGVVLWAAALLVFAFGWRGWGSVTARRPLGTSALVLLAAWALFVAFVPTEWLPSAPDAGGLAFGSVDIAVRVGAAIIAVVQIARAGVVPERWRWAPAWMLAAVGVAQAVPQVWAVATGPTDPMTLVALAVIAQVVTATAACLLGILATALGAQARVGVRATQDA